MKQILKKRIKKLAVLLMAIMLLLATVAIGTGCNAILRRRIADLEARIVQLEIDSENMTDLELGAEMMLLRDKADLLRSEVISQNKRLQILALTQRKGRLWRARFPYFHMSFCLTQVFGLTDLGRQQEVITIPNTVLTIGEHDIDWDHSPPAWDNDPISAPFASTVLTTVLFEEGSQLRSLGEDVFFNAVSLRYIVLPSTVTKIDWDAFAKTTSLMSLTIPVGVTDLQSCVFWGWRYPQRIYVEAPQSAFSRPWWNNIAGDVVIWLNE